MIERILEKSQELGRFLAQTSEYQALHKANREVAEDAETRELIETLSKSQRELLSYIEQGQEPPQELRESYESALEALQQRSSYQLLVAAQANFDKLMQKVNEEIARGVEAGDKSRIILPS